MKIAVGYKIWEIVENSFSEKKYRVIWYNYIATEGVKYICMQADKSEILYLTWIQLKPSKKEFFIWFTTNHEIRNQELP